MLSAACRWILGLKERVHGICCMPLDTTKGLKKRVHGVCCMPWILGHKERVHAVFGMPLDPRSEGESAWGLLHAARS
jgi:hypothetical protein